MKKLIALILMVGLLTIGGVPTVSASWPDEVWDNDIGYSYYILNGEATITNYSGYGVENVVIPSTIESYPVTGIAHLAFSYKSEIKSVVIPDTVKNIDKNAFSRCSNLENVTFGAGMTYIGEGMFQECESLKEISIPPNITVIKDFAFNDCYALEKLTIPDSVTDIGEMAFRSCYALTEVNFGKGLKRIGPSAFMQCSLIESIAFNEGLEEIGEQCFYGCRALNEINLPAGIKKIGIRAFDDTAYTAYDSPKWEKAINEKYGYEYNYALYIGEYLYQLGSPSGAFRVKEGTTLIADCAIGYGPTEIYIPASVKYITMDYPAAFSVSTHTAYIVDDANENYKSVDGVLYTKNMDTLLAVPFGSGKTSFTVPASVKKIVPYAFNYFRELEEIIFNEGLEELGDSCFSNCEKLQSVTLPNSLKIIGDRAFSVCSSLAEVSVGPNIKSIGQDAFNWTAFYNDESNKNADGELYLGDGKYLLEKSISNDISHYTVKDGTVLIADNAITASWMEKLTVELPDSVKYIGDSSLPRPTTDLITGYNIVSLGEDALGSNYKEIILTDAFESVSYRSFGSSNAEKIYLGNTITKIPTGAFEGAHQLKSITIPQSVTEIEEYAFVDCGELADVYYGGSKEDFDKITIGWGNDTFLNANFHFNYVNSKYTSDTSKMILEGKEINIEVTPPEDMIEKNVILVFYKDGEIIRVENVVYTGEDLDFDTWKEDVDEIQVFFWDMENGIKPMYPKDAASTESWQY